MLATAMGVSGVVGLALLAATATLAHAWLTPVPGGTKTRLHQTPALQRQPDPLATPVLVSRTGPGFFTYRPLYATRLADRPLLRRIGQALVTARRLGPPPDQPMWPGPPTPTLTVVLANGHQVSLAVLWVPYRPVHPVPGIHPGAVRILPGDVILQGLPAGPVILQSAFLDHLLTERTAFPIVAHPLRVSRQGRNLVVQGDGLIGRAVTLWIQPIPPSTTSVLPSAFPLTTVPLRSGQYRWVGPVRIPQGWRIYQPVHHWSLVQQVLPLRNVPFPPPPSGESIAIPISPRVSVSQVSSPAAALDALHQAAWPIWPATTEFPLWPKVPGSLAVTWRVWNGAILSGVESTRVDRVPGGYRVQIGLTYRSGAGASGSCGSAWAVAADGHIQALGSTGRPPEMTPEKLLHAAAVPPLQTVHRPA